VGGVTANVSIDGGPTTFVLFPGAGALAGRDDRLFPLAFQQRVARERLGLEEVAEIDGGHLPMLARPRELAECLVELA
jgi:pimeloyl-ACP methyl ester carboxylesterase